MTDEIIYDPAFDDLPSSSSLSSKEQGDSLELEALHFLHRFGWLRAREIGLLVYADKENSKVLAERLLRRLIKKKQISDRPLQTDGGGTFARAFLLSTSGAERLRVELGVDARSGKDVSISSSWKHDLISHQILALCHNKGFEIVTERELRQKSCHGEKIPDGLFTTTKGPWICIEVERSRKSGASMARQAKFLAAAAQGMEWRGYKIVSAVIAYEKTKGVDHQLRNVSALEKVQAASPYFMFFWPLSVNQSTFVIEMDPYVKVKISPDELMQEEEHETENESNLGNGHVHRLGYGLAHWWSDGRIIVVTINNEEYIYELDGRRKWDDALKSAINIAFKVLVPRR